MQSPDAPFQREVGVIRRALRSLNPAGPEAGAAELDWSTIDGAALGRLVRWHRCGPLMHWAFGRAEAPAPPPALLDEWRRATHATVARNAFLGVKLEELAGILAEAGIEFLVLKGPVLEAAVYAPLGCPRPYDDLDILVKPGSFLAARRLLVRHGYGLRVPLNDTEAAAQMRAGWDCGLDAPGGGLIVELCTGVAPAYLLPARRVDLWPDSAAVTLPGGERVRAPSPARHLFALILHGTKHLWSRLIWTGDLTGLAGQLGEEDWRLLFRMARAAGAARMVLTGLRLAADAGCGPLPTLYAQSAARDSQAARLARSLRARLDAGAASEPRGREELLFLLRVRERLRDRARHLARLALTPSYSDWRAVRLPGPLFFLYGAIRPLRLLIHAVRSARRRNRTCPKKTESKI